MQPHEVCRAIRPVNIGPVLGILDRLAFIGVNQAQAGKYPCDVVLQSHFPAELHALLDTLGLGGRLARAILRRLRPRQSIPPHVDAWMPQEVDWRRFQVPLTSDPAIVMRWPDDGVDVHLQPGWLYEVRYDRVHEVVHGADCDRIHLQIDQVDATL